MNENNVHPRDEKAIQHFAEEEYFCKLLYYLIKWEFIEMGPPHKKLTPSEATEPKYYKRYAVPALVYRCNHGRNETRRSQLATTILLKLVTVRHFHVGTRRLLPWSVIRNAGASLEFLRYHLNAPETIFYKGGELECSVRQLRENNFDLLFCLRAGHRKEALTDVGFHEEIVCVVSDVLEFGEDAFSEVKQLQQLKQAGFQRFLDIFTVEALKATQAFTLEELSKYRQTSCTKKYFQVQGGK
jgi:hypothetical protein